MTRSLSITSHADQRATLVYLYALEFSGGTLYITNGSVDIDHDGNTYEAVGGLIVHEPIEENADGRAQGVRLSLYGVDQTIISSVMSNQFRGRDATIYLAMFDPDTGVLDAVEELWSGKQLSDYEINEDRDPEGIEGGGSVAVETTISSIVAAINIVKSVRANIQSHIEMLRRAGLATTDAFFTRVPTLVGREIFWGTEAPDSVSTRYRGGGQYDENTGTKGEERVY